MDSLAVSLAKSHLISPDYDPCNTAFISQRTLRLILQHLEQHLSSLWSPLQATIPVGPDAKASARIARKSSQLVSWCFCWSLMFRQLIHIYIDHIRPDWETKLAAVRAAVARRANRRIIMRQVGDRLIPVGVTSGRVHPLGPEGAGEQAEAPEATSDSRGSRRARRRQQQQQDLNQILGTIGLGGQDLEEVCHKCVFSISVSLIVFVWQLMVMEAMRLSLMEHEEQQRREAEQKKRQSAGDTAAANSTENGGSSSSGSAPVLSSVAAATPMDVTSTPRSGRLSNSLALSADPLSLSSSPGSHLAVPGTSPLRNLSSSPQPRHSGEQNSIHSKPALLCIFGIAVTLAAIAAASTSVDGVTSGQEGSTSGSTSTNQVNASLASAHITDGHVLTIVDDESESPVMPSYVRLPSTAEMSVSDRPLLKSAPTSDTVEESSTEVN